MPKEDWKNNNLQRIFSLPPVESVLDVGCGLALKSKYIDADIRVGVDIFPKYLEHIESEVPYIAITHDIRKLSQLFLPQSFDIVMACDVIEHLEEEEALKLIADCERLARFAVILQTPSGFVPQNRDILGFGAHDLQTHRSGWGITQLEYLGYETKARKYRMSDAKRHTHLIVDPNITIIDAIKYV